MLRIYVIFIILMRMNVRMYESFFYILLDWSYNLFCFYRLSRIGPRRLSDLPED